MIAILWRYWVHPHAVAEFESAYCPDGAWAVLFGRAPGYAGTELIRGADGAYVTIDRWRSAADFDTFLAAHRLDYDALDRATEGWTRSEQRIGLFDTVGAGNPNHA